MTTRILAFAVSTLTVVTVGGTAFGAANSIPDTPFAATAQATDAAQKFAKGLPETVIVRVQDGTGEASMLESAQKLTKEETSVEAVHQLGAQFKPVDAASKGPAGPSEMDRSSSTSSWFFWYNPGYTYYVPTYYYGGYSYAYRTYCNYSYYGYTYYWYYRGW